MLYKNLKITITYSLLFSIALCTPFINFLELYDGLVITKQIWFYSASAILFLVLAFDLFSNNRNLHLSVNILDLALLIYYLYFLIRTISTPYIPLLYNFKFLNFTILLLFYFFVKYFCTPSVLHKNNDYHNFAFNKSNQVSLIRIKILCIVLILTGILQAIMGIFQLYGLSGSFHSSFKITGTFFNPAPYALYLASIFPLSLGMLLETNNFGFELTNSVESNLICMNNLNFKTHVLFKFRNKSISLNSILISLLSKKFRQFLFTFFYKKSLIWISIFAVISIGFILIPTMNRSSWLGVICGSFLIINYKYNIIKNIFRYAHTKISKIALILGLIIFISTICLGLFKLKSGSSNGRLLIWEITFGKIKEKPLFGYGISRFEAEYNNWQADYFKRHPNEINGPKGIVAGNTKYCFNEYLEVASELGITGLLFLFLVLISAFFGIKFELVALTNIKNTEKDIFILLILTSSLISILVTAFISIPFYSLPTHIIYFLLLGAISARIRAIPLSTKYFSKLYNRTIVRVLVVSAMFVVAVFLLSIAVRQFKAYYKWNKAKMFYQTENYDMACTLFSDLRIPLKYNGMYLQFYGKSLYMKKDYLEAIKILESATLFTSDEMLYTILGDTYKAIKKYSESELAYKHALYMAPHKLYPLYLLANMYFESGQNEKALTIAEEILNKIPKVESIANLEIVNAMRDLINRLNLEKEEILLKNIK